jgi:hypothetical protein
MADFDGGGLFPLWTRDGSELLFQTPDQRVMAVSYTANADSFAAGKPSPGERERSAPWVASRGNLLEPDLLGRLAGFTSARCAPGNFVISPGVNPSCTVFRLCAAAVSWWRSSPLSGKRWLPLARIAAWRSQNNLFIYFFTGRRPG